MSAQPRTGRWFGQRRRDEVAIGSRLTASYFPGAPMALQLGELWVVLRVGELEVTHPDGRTETWQGLPILQTASEREEPRRWLVLCENLPDKPE